jgi:hypothetical protein
VTPWKDESQKRSLRSRASCSAPDIFMRFLPKIFFHAAEEVRHFNAGWDFWWQKASHDAFALGDLDLMAVAQELLYSGKAVTEVAKGGFLHEAHFTIAMGSNRS